MNLVGGLIGGVVGGVIGGAIWAGVSYGTGYEIGWIAWGVGLIVGLGVAMGSKGQAGQLGGIVAAVLAIASILIAKYVAVELLVNKHFDTEMVIANSDVPAADQHEAWTAYIADQLVDERTKAGKPVNWPQGVNPEEADVEKDYPREIWADAKSRWKAMTAQQQRDFRDTAAASLIQNFEVAKSSAKSQITQEGFFQSFGLLDLVFGFLAVATAFRVGCGGVPGKAE